MSDREMEGKLDKAKDKTHEEEGKMTDDKLEEACGRMEKAGGKIKEEAGKSGV